MLLTVVSFILILAFLVLVHELGHFLVARKFGVAVEEFGLGFPPRLVSKVIGQTRWSLNLLPLGGFVKIKGEEGGNYDPDSFSSRGAGQRTAIVAAGVTMNVLAAWLILAALFSVGAPMDITPDIPRAYVRESRITITDVLAKSPAAEAGLLPDDKIAAIDGKSFSTVESVQSYVGSRAGETIRLHVLRNDKPLNFEVKPQLLPDFEPSRAVMGVGLAEVGLVRFPLPRALLVAAEATYGYLARIAKAFGGVIVNLWQGQGIGGALGGPVAIAVATGETVALGWQNTLLFTAILSLNLALINILPFPALDGGRIIFFVVEKLRGRPSRAVVEAWFHRVGFALLIALAVVVTYHDILRFIF